MLSPVLSSRRKRDAKNEGGNRSGETAINGIARYSTSRLPP